MSSVTQLVDSSPKIPDHDLTAPGGENAQKEDLEKLMPLRDSDLPSAITEQPRKAVPATTSCCESLLCCCWTVQPGDECCCLVCLSMCCNGGGECLVACLEGCGECMGGCCELCGGLSAA